MATPGRPARRKSTLAMVASAAGVSLATVSKVVHGREDVGADTRAQVQRLLDEHGYVPTSKRRPSGTRSTIELAFDHFMSPYATELQHGVIDAADELDIDVVVSRQSGRVSASVDDGTWAHRLQHDGRKGALLVTSDIDARQVTELQKAHLPLVVIDPVHAPEEAVVSIGATNWAGGLAATEHLLSLGHQRIAYIGGPADTSVNLARLHGYRAAMDEYGLRTDKDLIVGAEMEFQAGARLATQLLQLPRRPTAIFAITDVVALGVIQAAHTARLRVPEDLSVVGFDDTYIAAWSTPALTTVRTPLQDMGRLALRTLHRLIHGDALDSHHIELATQLVIRSSTTAPGAAAG